MGLAHGGRAWQGDNGRAQPVPQGTPRGSGVVYGTGAASQVVPTPVGAVPTNVPNPERVVVLPSDYYFYGPNVMEGEFWECHGRIQDGSPCKHFCFNQRSVDMWYEIRKTGFCLHHSKSPRAIAFKRAWREAASNNNRRGNGPPSAPGPDATFMRGGQRYTV